jgi:hypothetical protein
MGETYDRDLSGYPAPMELAVTRRPTGELPAELVEVMADYARRGKADNTWRAYEADLRHFAAWCDLEGLSALPAAPTAIAAYLAAHATSLSVSTLRRRLAAISVMHQAAGYTKANSPTAAAEVKAVWSGIRRAHGVAPQKVRAARTKVINAIVAQIGSKPIDVRDRALLLIGLPEHYGALSLSASTGPTSPKTTRACGSCWPAPRPTRKARPRPSACPMAPTPPPARCGPGGPGERLPRSTPARLFGPSPATVASVPRGSPIVA